MITPEQREQMAYDSQRVQDAERGERAERRAERHEERMSQAEAYRRATSGQNVYILH